jgi:DUF4097 and DUF4098 domain-containing protein YvlB
MAEQWQVESPRVIDIGGDDELVRELQVGVVGGHVDVVTHDDSPTARVEISQIQGTPLTVEWDGSQIKIIHGTWGQNLLTKLKKLVDVPERNRVTLSISVPESTRTKVSTVSASGLLAGLRAEAKATTVSGAFTLDDIIGDVDVDTVSGDVECVELTGPLTVNTVSGAVTAQHSDLPAVQINTVSGDVTLDLVNAASTISSNSVSGDVTVRTVHDGYDVKGATGTGQVVVDGNSVSRQAQKKGERVRGGDGGIRLDASAATGSIVLLRAVTGAQAS